MCCNLLNSNCLNVDSLDAIHSCIKEQNFSAPLLFCVSARIVFPRPRPAPRAPWLYPNLMRGMTAEICTRLSLAIYGTRILILIKQKCSSAHRWHISRALANPRPTRRVRERETRKAAPPCRARLPLDHVVLSFCFAPSQPLETNVWHLAFGAISSVCVCLRNNECANAPRPFPF